VPRGADPRPGCNAARDLAAAGERFTLDAAVDNIDGRLRIRFEGAHAVALEGRDLRPISGLCNRTVKNVL